MKKRKYLSVIISLCILLTACASEKTQTPQEPEKETEEQQEPEKQQEIESEQGSENVLQISNEKDYQSYSGTWTEGGITKEELQNNGGFMLTVEITEGNHFQGSIYAQQGLTDRFADISDIEGMIEQDEFRYDFSDDGWGGTGTLHFYFEKNVIRIEVENYQMSDENLSGYGISGTYEVYREGSSSDSQMKTADYGKEFQSINGCGVFLDSSDNIYQVYNEEICKERVSPCSTFKIISALAGLHNQVITSTRSTVGYDDTVYPVEAWNGNLDLQEAIQSSCVWYFRKVIDSVGKEEMQKELEQLEYGNCDITEWEGSGVNPLPELNGFWLDSSLKISPMEQVGVLRSIIDGDTIYTPEEVEILKEILLVESNDSGKIYGKTGTSSAHGGWFVGFQEKNDSNIYFAVYLNDENVKVSGEMAKEIAMKILRNHE